MILRILKYTLSLVLLLSCLYGQAQDEYLKKYYNFPEYSESVKSHTLIAGKSYLWGNVVIDNIDNAYLIITDTEGNQEAVFTYENARVSFNESVLYDESKEKFVVPIRFKNEEDKYGEQILEVNLEGLETGRYEYQFHDNEAVWEDAWSMVKYGDGYAISGMIYYNTDDIWARGGVVFLDGDYNKIQSHRTSSIYHLIENLMIDDQGQLWGVVRKWEFAGGNRGRQRLVALDEEEFITTEYSFYGSIPQEGGNDGKLAFHKELDAFVYTYLADDGVVVIGAIDKEGEILWSNVDFKPELNGEQHEIIVLKNGDIAITGQESYPSDINDNRCFNISRINKEGVLIWTRFYYHYRDDMELFDFELVSSILDPRSLLEDDDGNIYIMLGEGETNTDWFPMLIRVDSAGLIKDDEGIRQYIGIEHPPESLNSPRAIWHILNEDTGEMYRYSFADIWDGGLRLLRSDEMTGENWYETNKVMSGGLDKVIIKSFENGLLEWSPHNNYDFRLEEGEFLDLRYNSPLTNERAELIVEEVDEITLLDGRVRKRQRLRCKADTDGTEYGYRTWIQGIGDIDNFSLIRDVCRERQSEKILCYYAVGELMYVHPDYEGCITNVEELDKASELTVSPNPTSSKLSFSEPLSSVMIYDMMGRVVMTQNEKYGMKDLDVSMLVSGMYLIQGKSTDGTSYTTKCIKQ